MENCFAFNKTLEECTCLNVKKCAWPDCKFYKAASQARAEAANSPKKYKDYWAGTEKVIEMIDENQRDSI